MTEFRDGPVERGVWAERLQLHVISPEHPPRVHGYAAHDDIARHYSLVESQLLAHTGSLPRAELVRAVELAQRFIQVPHPGLAAMHSAILARFCGARDASIVGIAAVGLAEECERNAMTLASCENTATTPAALRDDSANEQRVAAMLIELLGAEVLDPPLQAAEGLFGVWIRVLRWAGITSQLALNAMWVQARLPLVVAEAERNRPGDFPNYPMQLPPIVFTATGKP
jgi:hypothetical protein